MASDFDILDVGNFRCVADYIYGGVGQFEEIKGITNIEEGCMLLAKHNTPNERKLVHCDIDMDGLGSGFIYKRFNQMLHSRICTNYIINRDRVHGLDEERVAKINAYNPTFVIILDSSSNLINLIKKFTCDVLVVDHHNLDASTLLELTGKTAGGEYVIVTNMADKSMPENCTEQMSGAMVLYGLLYEFNKRYHIMDNFHDLKLEQWVAVTLFSDVIPVLNRRNQYFISTLLANKEIEPTLKALMTAVKAFRIDKSLINFKISPLINSTVRAGASLKALHTILYSPQSIVELQTYRDIQKDILAKAEGNPQVYDDYLLLDITNMDIPKGYAGVIASQLGDSYANKCVFVYEYLDNLCRGSFRGALKHVDYRQGFEKLGCFAQGHKGAFGLRIPPAYVHEYMAQVCDTENYTDNYYISLGYKTGGLYHIEDMKEFKRTGNLVKLAAINSRVTGKDELRIIYSGVVNEPQQYGKTFVYDICGLECTAFEKLHSETDIILYPEFTNEVRIFAKNIPKEN